MPQLPCTLPPFGSPPIQSCKLSRLLPQDCIPDPSTFYAFLSVLERTSNPAVASHVIHFMWV